MTISRRPRFIPAYACCLFAIGCTTDFSSSNDDADTAVDTAVDTTGDVPLDTPADTTPADVDPDAPDIGPDIMPDGPMPTSVECTTANMIWVPYEDGTTLTHGCFSLDGCADVGLWIQMLNGDLMVLTGADMMGTEWGGFFWAAPVHVNDSFESATPQQLIHPDPYDSLEPSLRNASLVNRSPSMASILYPVRHWNEGTLVQNLRALNVWSGDPIGFQYRDFLSNVSMPVGEVYVSYARGLRTSWGFYYLLVMLEEETPLFFSNQLFGITIPEGDFGDNSITYGFLTDFRALQSGRNQSTFPMMPDQFDAGFAMPYWSLNMDDDIGAYQSGVWMHTGHFGIGDRIDEAPLETSSSFNGAPTGASLGPGTPYGIAALGSETRFGSGGMPPPYNLNVSVTDSLDPGTIVEGTGAIHIGDSLMAEMEYFDFLDAKMLHDPTRGIFHVVYLMYTTGAEAAIHVYSFHMDGTPAMYEGIPFVMFLDVSLLGAFDATIDPATGYLYFGRFDGEVDTLSTLSGYHIDQITCELVEGEG